MQLDTKTKYIIGGVIAVIVIALLIKYINKNNIQQVKPVSLKINTNYANDVVKVEPIPQPLVTDRTAADNANRVVYQSSVGFKISTPVQVNGETKTAEVNTLSYLGQITPSFDMNDPANADKARYERSLRTFTVDKNRNEVFHPLYDYNPSNYAVIYPCIQNICKDNNSSGCCDIEKPEFTTVYKASPQVYSRLYFDNFIRTFAKPEQTAVGTTTIKNEFRRVNTIISIYLNLINQGSVSSTGTYALKYGKYYIDNVARKVVTYDELTTPVTFTVGANQNEVLIEFDPVNLYNESRKKIDGFYFDIRRQLDDKNSDPRIYIGEILFNFKTDFDATKKALVDREFIKPSSVVANVTEGQRGREQQDIDLEAARCTQIGYMYNFTGDINTSECVKPCMADVDCQVDVFKEHQPNSNQYVKLTNTRCGGSGKNKEGTTFKYCTGSMPAPGPDGKQQLITFK
jgi:hypothetical protein